MNPGISKAIKGSSPNKHDIIQIVSVREVSIVERYAADAYLVQAIPKELKQAMQKIVIQISPTIIPF
jgi:hypothetical protein